MKNVALIALSFLLFGYNVQAKSTLLNSSEIEFASFRDYGNNFTFVEGGITFAIFPNGEFDFYMNSINGAGFEYYGKNVNISFNSGYNYDAYVQYDDFGAIVQIENVPIYYDYYGRVNRIGGINIYYNGNRLARLGGLRIYYDHYGNYSHYRGYINRYNRYYVYHPYHNYFARPFFDFRIVSHKPYRRHYRTHRYTYYKDHSKNRFYRNNYKRGHNRQRFATHKIPKQRSYNNNNDTYNRRTNEHVSRNNNRYSDTRRNNKRDIIRNENHVRPNYNKNKSRSTVQRNHIKSKRSVVSNRQNVKTQKSKVVKARKPLHKNSRKKPVISKRSKTERKEHNKTRKRRS